MVSNQSIVGFVTVWCFVTTGCVPVPSDVGGSIPPPTIDSGVAAPPLNPNPNPIGDGGTGGDTLVFAVSVDGNSLAIDAIVIGAVLSVTQNADTFGVRTIVEARLQDTQNAFPLGDTGIVGGLLLTASRGSLGGFDLSQDQSGNVVAILSQGGGQSSADRFVLPEGMQAFVSGDVGITYEVTGGSRFSFVIAGDRVTGSFVLNGFPLATLGESEVYEGTFTGTRTR